MTANRSAPPETPALTRCTRCVLDTSVGDISFDGDGVCKYCKIHDIMESTHPLGAAGESIVAAMVDKIRKRGARNEYDCIVGVSGGRDSTYTLYLAKQLGLRPLAVHFDNGWNSETAVRNIERATSTLDVDLHTVVADWEEFRDLQIAFLRASVPDADVPTDYAIYSVLFQTAAEYGIKYILEGHSFRTEGTSPISWTYMDGRYVRNVHKMYGSLPITSFPIMSLPAYLYYVFGRRITHFRPLEYVEYRHADVDALLAKELGWEYYGGHHHESVYTHFFQSYLLPKKFGIDKRKTEFSALVRSGSMDRADALASLDASEYEWEPEVVSYTLKKLGMSQDDLNEIIATPVRSFHDFGTYYPLIQALRPVIRVAAKLHLVPPILFHKYAS